MTWKVTTRMPRRQQVVEAGRVYEGASLTALLVVWSCYRSRPLPIHVSEVLLCWRQAELDQRTCPVHYQQAAHHLCQTIQILYHLNECSGRHCGTARLWDQRLTRQAACPDQAYMTTRPVHNENLI